MSSSSLPSRASLVTRVFLPFAAGYYLSYLMRTVNAVISPDLTRELGLGAADLGLLTSTYFFAFALAQIPVGIALDRYGPRRVEALLLLLTGLGAALFARRFAGSMARAAGAGRYASAATFIGLGVWTAVAGSQRSPS